MNEALKQKLSKLPVAPGVYFHKNTVGEIIYVGKAAVLKNRVRQYFQKTHKDVKTEALVREIADTDWIVVDTEMDALFLESEMIKRYMPKWNILLRDDKTVSYVRINMKDEVPYVSFTRNPMDDKATYIGPFYGKSAVEKAVRVLRRIFPYYTRPYNGKKTLDTDLGLTPGIEIGKTSAKDYKRNLRKLIRYLEGDREKLLKELEKTMLNESSKGNYELAAEARNQLFGLRELKKKIVFSDKEFLDISNDQALRQLQELLNLSEPPRRIEGYDISHQSGVNTVGSMVVFINGAAARSEYRKFKVRTSTSDDLKSLREVISRRLKHKEWEYPDLMILDGGITQVKAVLPLVEQYNIPVIGRNKSGNHSKSASVTLVFPKRSDLEARPKSSSSDCQPPDSPGLEHLELPSGSHISRLIARIDEEAHRFAIAYHSLLKRKNMLK
ncbi:MAG: GIY-YIG nuclease family protein [Candidatus Saccharibacteria bacterium]|uniref:UvrABC system protein C n=1 Tax=Candidatus Nanosyncoccus alces TaxID=2171997 RepID=A0ABY0FNR6_9BACT|nr:GIY-YIG nuclease family protein [Candidatus Nanosyncoccus alces]MDO4398780.1 GIY-YIG nuclease family protein [Candidatus Saccharibacteria bacterium]RYC74515.1 UvrABC system protein C [Candidatus Nanosyncoccus alces]